MVLIAHYDAASHENDPGEPLVVAALVATKEQWVEFERAWRTILRLFGVSHLHMMECAHWKKEFKSWKGNDEKRREFLASLIEILKRNIMYTAVFRVVPDDYNAVNEEYVMETEFWSGAYSLTAMVCTSYIERWKEHTYPHATLTHLVEHGDAGQGVMREWSHSLGSAWPLAIVPEWNEQTGWFHPFGACDLLAYEHRVAVSRKLKGEDPFARGSFMALLRALKPQAHYLDKSGLTQWCLAHPEEYPRRDGEPSAPFSETQELKAAKERISVLKSEIALHKKKRK